jgi:ABC-type branched-subunit amino acid transport system ATPase component/ABC-type branched-subunit amino acid transport system permease subunit
MQQGSRAARAWWPSPAAVARNGARRGWDFGAQALAIAVFAWAIYRYQPYLAGIVLIYAISALGLDWIMTRAGQVSLANAPLMAIGAFTTAFVVRQTWGDLPVAMIVSALVGALTGFVIGVPALRIRGLYLVLTTLALQFLIADGLQLYEEHTGQLSGYSIPGARLAGISLGSGGAFVVFLTIFFILACFFLRGVYRGAPGRAWSATRQDEVAASAMGLDVSRAKMVAFVGSSSLIAVSGCLLAYYSQLAAASTFTLDFAISFAVMLIIGGTGSVAGVLLGAAIVTLAPAAIQSASQQAWVPLPLQNWLGTNVYLVASGLYGLLVLIVLLFLPAGIVPTVTGAAKAAGRRLRERRTAAAARPATTGGPLAPAVAPAAAGPGPGLLTVTDLHVQYRSGANAVSGVSIDVREGQIVAILGRNGAGKTSLLRGIGGFFGSEEVRVRGAVGFDGSDVSGKHPRQIARRGIILVPERDKIFRNLTVNEHLKLATARSSRRHSEELLATLGPLADKRDTPAGLLSGGQRQMLAIGMALCANPRLLMVDEFSLGLAPIAIQEIGALLRDVAERLKLSMLLVEQNTDAALRIADYIYLMDSGTIVASGSSARFHDTSTLTKAYLGAGEGGPA